MPRVHHTSLVCNIAIFCILLYLFKYNTRDRESEFDLTWGMTHHEETTLKSVAETITVKNRHPLNIDNDEDDGDLLEQATEKVSIVEKGVLKTLDNRCLFVDERTSFLKSAICTENIEFGTFEFTTNYKFMHNGQCATITESSEVTFDECIPHWILQLWKPPDENGFLVGINTKEQKPFYGDLCLTVNLSDKSRNNVVAKGCRENCQHSNFVPVTWFLVTLPTSNVSEKTILNIKEKEKEILSERFCTVKALKILDKENLDFSKNRTDM